METVARAANRAGLPWTTSKVSDLETGRLSPNLTTLLAVTAALSDAAGRLISPGELFGGDGLIAVTDWLHVEAAELRAAMSGQPLTAVMGPLVPRMVAFTGRFTDGATMLAVLPVWAAGVDPMLIARIRADLGDSDLRACRQAGVDPIIGAAAMAKLWGRTLRDQRDFMAGLDANAQKRGQIARALRAQLKEMISGDD